MSALRVDDLTLAGVIHPADFEIHPTFEIYPILFRRTATQRHQAQIGHFLAHCVEL